MTKPKSPKPNKFWPARQGPPYDAAIFAAIVMGTVAVAVAVYLCH